jgi:ketosteroid isomerase-like protein
MAQSKDERAILGAERRALDRWAAGDPVGYAQDCAEDATYFDDIAAQQRVDGRAAIQGYFETLAGKIPEHRYEIVDPKVQVYGDVGVLTLRYNPSAPPPDNRPLQPWKMSAVYRKTGGAWRAVHLHWSMIKS